MRKATRCSGGTFWGLSPTLLRPFGHLAALSISRLSLNPSNSSDAVGCPHGLHTNTRAQRNQQPTQGLLQVTGGPEMPVFPPIDFSELWASAQHSSTHLSALLTSASDPGSESLFHVMKVCLEFTLLP